MATWKKPSAGALLAEYLRDELGRGRWSGRMPGVIRLADEFGSARNTVEAALRELEQEGVLMAQGYGRSRLVNVGKRGVRLRLRVAILTHEPLAQAEPYFAELQHMLHTAGLDAFFMTK